MTFLAILIGLLPSFLLVGLGGLLRKRLSANAWQGLDKLNFEILFPALLFVAASQRPLEVAQVVGIAPLVWALLAVGLVVGYGARRFGPEQFLDFAGAWQTAWRFNTALAFIAIATTDKADAGVMAVAVGMAVAVANGVAVRGLSRGGRFGLGGAVKNGALKPFLSPLLGGREVGGGKGRGRKASEGRKKRREKGNKRSVNRKYPLKPLGEKPMVSTCQRRARAWWTRRSNVSDAEGFGTIRWRHRKYQPYIQVRTAMGIMNSSEPTISMTFFVRNFTTA